MKNHSIKPVKPFYSIHSYLSEFTDYLEMREPLNYQVAKSTSNKKGSILMIANYTKLITKPISTTNLSSYLHLYPKANLYTLIEEIDSIPIADYISVSPLLASILSNHFSEYFQVVQ